MFAPTPYKVLNQYLLKSALSGGHKLAVAKKAGESSMDKQNVVNPYNGTSTERTEILIHVIQQGQNSQTLLGAKDASRKRPHIV